MIVPIKTTMKCKKSDLSRSFFNFIYVCVESHESHDHRPQVQLRVPLQRKLDDQKSSTVDLQLKIQTQVQSYLGVRCQTQQVQSRAYPIDDLFSHQQQTSQNQHFRQQPLHGRLQQNRFDRFSLRDLCLWLAVLLNQPTPLPDGYRCQK